ncbi:MAG: hypothetical protein QME12_03290 [Nanoarchaeota archaeon]|nr:hypothetical protein [Nanoarchaeota archaeon]
MKKRKNKPVIVKKDYNQLALSLFRKHIKRPFLHFIDRTRKYLILLFEYIRMKRIHAVAKMHYDMGKEELELVKKQARKEAGREIVDEFEKMSKEKEREVKPMTKKAILLRVFMFKRIKRNLLKLFHPVRMLKKSKKTKTVAYTNGWTEINKKGIFRK